MSTSDDDCRCDNCSGELCPGDVLCGTCGEECDPDRTRGFKIKRKMTRGDTEEIDYDLLDRDGAPLDLSAAGAKAWFTVKRYLSDADQFAVHQATIANGGILPRDGGSLASGRVRVTVPATATASVAEGTTKLYYDLQVKDALGRISTVEKGLFVIDADVTRATT